MGYLPDIISPVADQAGQNSPTLSCALRSNRFKPRAISVGFSGATNTPYFRVPFSLKCSLGLPFSVAITDQPATAASKGASPKGSYGAVSANAEPRLTINR